MLQKSKIFITAYGERDCLDRFYAYYERILHHRSSCPSIFTQQFYVTYEIKNINIKYATIHFYDISDITTPKVSSHHTFNVKVELHDSVSRRATGLPGTLLSFAIPKVKTSMK